MFLAAWVAIIPMASQYLLSDCKSACGLNSKEFQECHQPLSVQEGKRKERVNILNHLFFYNIYKYKFILQVSKEEIAQVESCF